MAACIMRAIWSDAPPAPAATTISTGLLGSQAPAGAAASATVSAAVPPTIMFFATGIASLLEFALFDLGPPAENPRCPSWWLRRILPLCARGARAPGHGERAATLGRPCSLEHDLSPKCS